MAEEADAVRPIENHVRYIEGIENGQIGVTTKLTMSAIGSSLGSSPIHLLLLTLLLSHTLLLLVSLLPLDSSEQVVSLDELWVVRADTLFLHLLVLLR